MAESEYQARWISRGRYEALRRSGKLGHAVLLDTFSGYIVVEPVGSDLGDRDVLSRQEADYELQPVYYTGPKAKLRGARRLLGLEHEAESLAPMTA